MESSQEGYRPPLDFEKDMKDPLVEISLTGSTELWLIQWPNNQLRGDDFTGKELSLKLRRDGHLGSFKSSSGKSYDMVSFAAQEPDASVFLSSASESKVVGKISRRVCLVRYPEPEMEPPSSNFPSLSDQRSPASWKSNMSHSFTTLRQSSKQRYSQTGRGLAPSITTPAHDSRQSSEEKSKHSKNGWADRNQSSVASVDRSTQDSGGEGWSSISSVGFYEKSSKKKGIVKGP